MSGRSWCEVVSIAERQPDGQQTQRLRGRCDVMANRSDWGRGQPDECRGHHSPISRMGPRPCIPSRPAVMCAAQTGRTQDCTRPQSQSVKSILAMREPSTQDTRSCLVKLNQRAPDRMKLRTGPWLCLGLMTAPKCGAGLGASRPEQRLASKTPPAGRARTRPRQKRAEPHLRERQTGW